MPRTDVQEAESWNARTEEFRGGFAIIATALVKIRRRLRCLSPSFPQLFLDGGQGDVFGGLLGTTVLHNNMAQPVAIDRSGKHRGTGSTSHEQMHVRQRGRHSGRVRYVSLFVVAFIGTATVYCISIVTHRNNGRTRWSVRVWVYRFQRQVRNERQQERRRMTSIAFAAIFLQRDEQAGTLRRLVERPRTFRRWVLRVFFILSMSSTTRCAAIIINRRARGPRRGHRLIGVAVAAASGLGLRCRHLALQYIKRWNADCVRPSWSMLAAGGGRRASHLQTKRKFGPNLAEPSVKSSRIFASSVIEHIKVTEQ